MTTWTLKPQAPADDLSDLMAALDALPTDKPKRKAASPVAKPTAVEPPPFVQMWFPRAIVMHATRQECSCCGQTFESVTGMFLEDQHRNGALQQKRVQANVVPPEYYGLPTRQQWVVEELAYCVICFQTEFRVPEPTLPSDLVRALTPEDLNSLKGDA